METAWSTLRALDPARWDRTLFEGLLEQCRRRGNAVALEDQERNPLSYRRLLLGSLILGRKLAERCQKGDRVGVMLPNVNATAVTLFGLLAYGCVPAMLNFTTGAGGLISAANSIDVKFIVTSRRFVSNAKLDAKIEALAAEYEIVYLEDVRAAVGLIDRLRGLLQSRRADRLHARYKGKPTDIAVILFTSGTERQPKGVALTHANLLANIEQVQASIDCTDDDILFNALPVFHAFGLTAGLLLPVLIGFKGVLYPTPLHYDEIPKFARETRATIMIGIDTFAAAWARSSGPEDFRTLRLMVLGAEKVKDATRRIWAERCGIDILEGYGVTEAAPVVAVNRPGHNRIGTVGPPLPGIEVKLQPVEGIDVGQKLLVRGPNVMAGYYFHDRPGVLVPPVDGWHDTGDIVTIDEAGAIAIAGRAKRFAKIAGEMVSLSVVEGLVADADPEAEHAVVSVPDPRKGEALVVVTTNPNLTVDAVRKAARSARVSELLVPSRIVNIREMPLLGNGKTDYVSLEKLAGAAQAG